MRDEKGLSLSKIAECKQSLADILLQPVIKKTHTTFSPRDSCPQTSNNNKQVQIWICCLITNIIFGNKTTNP